MHQDVFAEILRCQSVSKKHNSVTITPTAVSIWQSWEVELLWWISISLMPQVELDNGKLMIAYNTNLTPLYMTWYTTSYVPKAAELKRNGWKSYWWKLEQNRIRVKVPKIKRRFTYHNTITKFISQSNTNMSTEIQQSLNCWMPKEHWLNIHKIDLTCNEKQEEVTDWEKGSLWYLERIYNPW